MICGSSTLGAPIVLTSSNTAEITVITEIASESAMQNAIKLIENDGSKVESLIRVQV